MAGSKPGERRGGRQKGTPNKATAEIKAIAGAYTQEAIETLAKIMRDSESDAARVAAVKEILDRGHGKARQAVDVDGALAMTVTEIRRKIVGPHD